MVEKDISSFLEEFRKTEKTLSDFNDLWKAKNMSCAIYCSPNPKEQYDYMREIFEYLIVGIDRGILTGKGAIFVLYAYFVIQPLNPWQRINIPITNEELKNLKCLVQAYCDNQEHDVVYLFNKLLAVQAFEVIPTHDTIVWGNKFVPKERFVSFNCKKDTVRKPSAVDSLFHDGSVIRKLKSLSVDYNDIKESLSEGRLMLDCVSQDLHEKILNLENDFHDEIQRLQDEEKVNNLPPAIKNCESKLSVKEKAWNAPVDERTPLEKKRRRNKVNYNEEISIKAEENNSNDKSYIPFPKS